MQPWGTEAQLKLLKAWRKKYREHQAAGTVAFFWPDFFAVWFELYPDRTYDDGNSWEERLQSWFRNHSRGPDDGDELETAPSKPGRKGMVKLGQSSRKLTRLQMYQRQYYREKWSVLCNKLWKEYLDGPEDVENKKARITYINALCTGFLEKETDEVKREIDVLMARQDKGEKFMQEEVSGEAGEGAEGEQGGEREKSGNGEGGEESGQSAFVEKLKAAENALTTWNTNIQGLPRTIAKLLKEIHTKTGLVATILVGGPHPGDDGKIVTMCADAELGKSKRTFKKSYRNYPVAVEQEFVKYLHEVFPIEERNRRSIVRVQKALSTASGIDINMEPEQTGATGSASSVPKGASPTITPSGANSVDSEEIERPFKVGPPRGKKRDEQVSASKKTKKGDEGAASKKAQEGDEGVASKKAEGDEGAESSKAKEVDEEVGPSGTTTERPRVRPRRLQQAVPFVPPWLGWQDREGEGEEPAEPSEKVIDDSTAVTTAVDQVHASSGSTSSLNEKSKGPISEGRGPEKEQAHREETGTALKPPSPALITASAQQPTATPNPSVIRPSSTPDASPHPSATGTLASVPTINVNRSADPQNALITHIPIIPMQTPSFETSTNQEKPSDSSGSNSPAVSSEPRISVAQTNNEPHVNPQNHTSAVTLDSDSIEPISHGDTPVIIQDRQDTFVDPPASSPSPTPAKALSGVSALENGNRGTTQRTSIPSNSPKSPLPSQTRNNNTLPDTAGQIGSFSPPDDEAALEPSKRPNPFKPAVDRPEEKYVTEVVHFLERVAGEREKALPHLKLTDLREDVEDLVNVWAGIDRSMGYPLPNAKGHKLDIKSRPEQVAWWLGRGRRFERIPPIDDVMDYGEKVREWWIILQPLWRRDQAKEEWPLSRNAPLKEDWESLAKGGGNGLMMFLVALGWWLGAVEDKKAAAELASVVDDVRWVLDEIDKGMDEGQVVEMLIKREGAGKRGREDEKGGKAKKRRTAEK